MFTFAKTADLFSNRRRTVTINWRSSGRSSDSSTVFGVVGGLHPTNLTEGTFAPLCLASCCCRWRKPQTSVVHGWNILPRLGTILFNKRQCLFTGSAGFPGHQGEIILIINMDLDQDKVGIADSTELRPFKLAGTNTADSLHYVRVTFPILGHDNKFYLYKMQLWDSMYYSLPLPILHLCQSNKHTLSILRSFASILSALLTQIRHVMSMSQLILNLIRKFTTINIH